MEKQQHWSMSNIKILIFEDKPDFVDSLRELIRQSDGLELVGAYGNGKNALKEIAFHTPDVVLMDIDMPVENGLQSLRAATPWKR